MRIILFNKHRSFGMIFLVGFAPPAGVCASGTNTHRRRKISQTDIRGCKKQTYQCQDSTERTWKSNHLWKKNLKLSNESENSHWLSINEILNFHGLLFWISSYFLDFFTQSEQSERLSVLFCRVIDKERINSFLPTKIYWEFRDGLDLPVSKRWCIHT